jgi:asparagine synthase (glutamine-hydrolysing)
MPGIAGVISAQPAETCQRLLGQMIGSMQHEKFHVAGRYSAPELGVFVGWVGLQDTSDRCQPMVGEGSDVAAVLYGEYFVEPDRVRAEHTEHVQRGYASRLATLYDHQGDACFEDLDGLFSGVVIDRRERKALLFNDRYGLERVYYHKSSDGFFFASEAKALLRVLPKLRALDDDALREFLHYGCTLNWKSLFRNVGILPGGSLWTFTPDDRCHKRRYFVAAAWESQPTLATESFADAFGRLFRRTVPSYFESDRTVGISLTGGLDTRMIMACRPAGGHDVICYTFAGPTGDTVDVRLAAQVAKACGVPHQVLRLGDDFFANYGSLVDRTVYITDGYLGACGAHEIYLNQKARQLSPVRLTGNFGSEILRGATTFKPVGLSAEVLHPDVRRALSPERLPPRQIATHPVSFAACEEIPWHLFGLLRAGQSQVTTRMPYLNNELVGLAFRAPRHLKKSSTPALRVIRETDPELARIRTDSGLLPASRLSSFFGSLWHRPTFKLDYWRNVELPKSLSGFDALISGLLTSIPLVHEHRYLHYRRWFQKPLADYVREQLSDPQLLRSHLWNGHALEHLAEDHISGRKNYLREITTVLTCSAIERLLFHASA